MSACFLDALALRDQRLHLPQLGNNILRLVTLLSYLYVLVLARKPYLRANFFIQAGSNIRRQI
ncbi:hypothetical protein AU375_03342 [Methylobacterium radiotolerans]|nr:hypothetical protein AU375_03342 [Methylobacterium radiotolerans]